MSLFRHLGGVVTIPFVPEDDVVWFGGDDLDELFELGFTVVRVCCVGVVF